MKSNYVLLYKRSNCKIRYYHHFPFEIKTETKLFNSIIKLFFSINSLYHVSLLCLFLYDSLSFLFSKTLFIFSLFIWFLILIILIYWFLEIERSVF